MFNSMKTIKTGFITLSFHTLKRETFPIQLIEKWINKKLCSYCMHICESVDLLAELSFDEIKSRFSLLLVCWDKLNRKRNEYSSWANRDMSPPCSLFIPTKDRTDCLLTFFANFYLLAILRKLHSVLPSNTHILIIKMNPNYHYHEYVYSERVLM